MNPTSNPENNFFQINLSQEGANWLLRVAKITVWSFSVISITCVLSLTGVGIRLFNETFDEDSWISILGKLVLPLCDVLFIILGFIQMWHYLKFTRLCRKAIEFQQSELFNKAFQPLLKNALMVIIMAVLQLLATSLAVCWQLMAVADKP